MLRKRSRPVSSSKQATVCDHTSNKFNFPIPNSEKSHKPTSFLFNSPRIIKDFFSKDPIMSPSSVLDTKKPFSSSGLTLQKQTQNPNPEKHSWEQPAIGLALIDNDHRDEKGQQMGPTHIAKPSKQRTKLVVFGSHLKIQIPNQSPMEFGIKTPKSNLLGHVVDDNSTQKKEGLSVKDMELSEDYTCVISHGPNPTTTHIYGNCVVKSCCGVDSSANNRFSYGVERAVERQNLSQGNANSDGYENSSFLSFCHHCNKKIGQGKDIYMYRGENAFCSQECRGQEMLFDGIEC